MDYSGKVVWITGASSGIGAALSNALLAEGANVVLSGRRQAALESVAGSSSRALVLPFETTDFSRLPAAVQEAWSWKDGIDLLINNAGISQRSLAIDTDFEVYRRIMEVDYFAPIRLTQLVLPRMVERRQGKIAIVSSVAGKLGVPLRTAYCAAKHACLGYFDALRAEVEQAHGIEVSVIVPGFVKTDIAINALTSDGQPLGHSDANIENGMSVEEAAATILCGLTRGQREINVVREREAGLLALRAQDSNRLFALFASQGAELASARVNPEEPTVNR